METQKIIPTTNLNDYKSSINWNSIASKLFTAGLIAYLSLKTGNYIYDKFKETPIVKPECIGAILEVDGHTNVFDPVTGLRAVYDDKSGKYQSVSIKDETVPEPTPEMYLKLDEIRKCNLK